MSTVDPEVIPKPALPAKARDFFEPARSGNDVESRRFVEFPRRRRAGKDPLAAQIEVSGWLLNIHRRGFTLIELLVVIAIIALLVSILVPSLSEAQWMTKMTMCQSNLHHVGLAVGAYMTSYGMDHPFIFYRGTGDGSKESSRQGGSSAGPGNPAEAMLKDGYENFLENAEPFFCPCEERTFETHYDMYGQDGGFGRIWGTYGWVYPHLA